MFDSAFAVDFAFPWWSSAKRNRDDSDSEDSSNDSISDDDSDDEDATEDEIHWKNERQIALFLGIEDRECGSAITASHLKECLDRINGKCKSDSDSNSINSSSSITGNSLTSCSSLLFSTALDEIYTAPRNARDPILPVGRPRLSMTSCVYRTDVLPAAKKSSVM